MKSLNSSILLTRQPTVSILPERDSKAGNRICRQFRLVRYPVRARRAKTETLD